MSVRVSRGDTAPDAVQGSGRTDDEIESRDEQSANVATPPATTAFALSQGNPRVPLQRMLAACGRLMKFSSFLLAVGKKLVVASTRVWRHFLSKNVSDRRTVLNFSSALCFGSEVEAWNRSAEIRIICVVLSNVRLNICIFFPCTFLIVQAYLLITVSTRFF